MQKTYSISHIKADGHVIGITLIDEIQFDVLLAFINHDNSYDYEDINLGGSWITTDPKNIARRKCWYRN